LAISHVQVKSFKIFACTNKFPPSYKRVLISWAINRPTGWFPGNYLPISYPQPLGKGSITVEFVLKVSTVAMSYWWIAWNGQVVESECCAAILEKKIRNWTRTHWRV